MRERNTALLLASDGWPFLLAVLVALIAAVALEWWWLAAPAALLLVLLVLLFRDPERRVPAQPHAVMSPVDGRVLGIEALAHGILEGPALRLRLRVDNFGAYAARSPIQGQVMELADDVVARPGGVGAPGLWVRSDLDQDVVVLIRGWPLLGRARAFVGYGERIGQGQPAAWLRIAREVEVYIPAGSLVPVAVGERVWAGRTALARFQRDGG